MFCAFLALVTAPSDRLLSQMIEADRALNRSAHEKGMRPAFTAAEAPGFEVVGPDLLNHLATRSKKKAAASEWLLWEPTRAEISMDGTLGYTEGDWTARRSGKFVAGNYVRVWLHVGRKWQVKLDVATQCAAPEVPSGKVERPKRAAARADQTPDQAGKSISASGFLPTYAADAVFLRPDAAPLVAVSPLRPNPKYTGGSSKAALSTAPDLAVTWGSIPEAAQKFAYLRIWRYVSPGQWQVVLEYLDRSDKTTESPG